MKGVILITGTPGTGKTVLGRELSLLLKRRLISVSEYAKNNALFEQKDVKRDCFELDKDKLSLSLRKEVAKSVSPPIIEGHMSHFFPAEKASVCLVCRTDIALLKKRLMERGYSAEKVRENLDSEIFEICRTEAIEEGHAVEEVDTSHDLPKSLSTAKSALRKHGFNLP